MLDLVNLSDLDDCPFVLTKRNSQPTNVIVGDDLNIQGIVGWEWACTVPRNFFSPQVAFTANDMVASDCASVWFHIMFISDHHASGKELNLDGVDDLIPHALRDHEEFAYLYFKHLFPAFYKGCTPREVIAQFLDRDTRAADGDS